MNSEAPLPDGMTAFVKSSMAVRRSLMLSRNHFRCVKACTKSGVATQTTNETTAVGIVAGARHCHTLFSYLASFAA
jgi:hypothetical protein